METVEGVIVRQMNQEFGFTGHMVLPTALKTFHDRLLLGALDPCIFEQN
jgi:hypothetical protein